MESEDTAVNPSFGAMLRGFRRAAGLTQEELAARAGMSARGLRFLEQGMRQPYRDTVQRLATALALSRTDQAVLAAAARASSGGRRDPPRGGPRHNLPVQVTSFVGREQE
jgi:transcriptional regulator with XRE-family HTH domain